MIANDTISMSSFLSRSSDNEIWKPIISSEVTQYQKLIHAVHKAFKSGTKKEKGDSLEDLMTYIYDRFQNAYVKPNVHEGDNQIDHIIKFLDVRGPLFIYENIGTTIIGESKNHKNSISSREVADLFELLRSKNSKLGIFSSYNSFSRGAKKNPWVFGEGKRRKLALSTNKIVIGFTITELESLTEKNFYTLLKQKYESIKSDIYNDDIDNPHGDFSVPYNRKLYYALDKLFEEKIINEESYLKAKRNVETTYGEY